MLQSLAASRGSSVRSRVGALTIGLLLLAATGCMYGAGAHGSSARLGLLDNFHAIEPQRAYRCAQLNANALRSAIQTYGFKTVINLRGRSDGDDWYDREVAVARALGIQHVDIDWEADALPSRAELLKLYDTYRDAQYPLLIHCKSGADRTGAAAAIWRMQIHGDSRAQARRELSLTYGHMPAYFHMDQLVRMFQNDRDWIVRNYPGAGRVSASQLMTTSVLNGTQAGQAP